MLRRRSAGGTALAAGGIAGGFRERFRVPSESLRVCAGAIRCSPGFVSEFRTIVSKASRNRFVAVPSVSFAGRTESPVCFGMRPRIAALQSRAGRDSSAARGPARGVRSAGCGRFCLRKGTRKVLRCGTAAETHEPAAKCGPPPRTAEKPREERAPHGGGGEPPALPGRQCRTFVRSRSHRSLLCAVADAVRKRPEHPSRQTAPCKYSLPNGIRHRRPGGRKTVRGAGRRKRRETRSLILGKTVSVHDRCSTARTVKAIITNLGFERVKLPAHHEKLRRTTHRRTSVTGPLFGCATHDPPQSSFRPDAPNRLPRSTSGEVHPAKYIRQNTSGDRHTPAPTVRATPAELRGPPPRSSPLDAPNRGRGTGEERRQVAMDRTTVLDHDPAVDHDRLHIRGLAAVDQIRDQTVHRLQMRLLQVRQYHVGQRALAHRLHPVRRSLSDRRGPARKR